MNKLHTKFFFILMTSFLVGCVEPNTPPVEVIKTVKERLESIDGIKSVEQVANKASSFTEKYICEIEQKINWNDENSETFNQRFLFCYAEESTINAFHCGGYSIDDEGFKVVEGDQLSYHYSANFINIEYRFFGKSTPSDFTLGGVKYYDCLTSEFASKDFHHIVTEINKAFPGKSCFSGASKGGYTTEMMAMYFPDDCNSYVSYVAPLCDGPHDTRMIDFINNEIGNNGFGQEVAQEYRDVCLEFQKNLLREDYRTDMLRYAFPKENANGRTKTTLTDNELFEASIGLITSGYYQYGQYDTFATLKYYNDLPERTAQQRSFKKNAFLNMMAGQFSRYVENEFTPYYVQAYMEMGNYSIDLDYLRDAGAYIITDPSRDEYLLDELGLTEEQLNTFSYDGSAREALINWMKTTDKDIIKIVGKDDTWYSVRAPKTDNPHIHYYEVNNCHNASLTDLSIADRTYVTNLLDSQLL